MDAFDKYIGRVFDKRYKIEKVIGVGGMAIVFKAEDILMNRTVAIKMLKNDVAGDTEALRRFINESKAVAMLSHENIVNIYDVSVKGNTKYIVMEYIEGITLKAFLKHKGGSLSWRETLNISEQILRALEHAHSKGVIHRDIKPQNIMLLKNGLIKVADFGIAKLPDTDSFTVTDQAIGTVNYISPEQAMNKEPIDERSDLYSVGVLMYELSCGELPFTGDTPVAVAYKHVNETPRSPREIKPEMPQGLEQIIMRAMEKSPEMRYQSAKQMLTHISALRKNPGIKFRSAAELEAMKAGQKKKKKKAKKPAAKKTVRERGGLVLPIILGVFSAFMIIVFIYGCFFVVRLFNMSLSDVPEETRAVKDVKIKNYVGMIYNEDLREELSDLGYKVTLKAGSKGTKINEIVLQNPEGGSERKKTADLELVLYVYTGATKEILPDLSYKAFTSVRAEYSSRYELEAERIDDQNVPAEYIVRTDPPAGSEVELGQKIKVYISRGFVVEKKVVPNICGILFDEANKKITALGFAVGDVTFSESEFEKNTVIFQSVTASTEAAVGTEIDIIVSLGPPESETEEEETAEEAPEETAEATAEP
jgi:serine/threonine-protein kinase